jgi:hypothetical protein
MQGTNDRHSSPLRRWHSITPTTMPPKATLQKWSSLPTEHRARVKKLVELLGAKDDVK